MLTVPDEEFLSLIDEMMECTMCELSQSRTRVVPYRGDPRTDIMILAEAPGAEEEKQGKAMVGYTGSYFVKLLERNGLPVNKIYITNCVLCRPPNNVDPKKHQMDACGYWFARQIQMIEPKFIIAVGRYAAAKLLPELFETSSATITSIEGRFCRSMFFGDINIVPVRHPSAILRQPTSQEKYENMISLVVRKILESLRP